MFIADILSHFGIMGIITTTAYYGIPLYNSDRSSAAFTEPLGSAVRADFPPLRTVHATFTAHGAPSMQIDCCVYVK